MMSLFNNNQFESFDTKFLTTYPVVLVEFYADWNGSCQIMSPVLKDIKNHFNGELKICRVNIDTEKLLTENYKVNKTPSYLIFQKGKIIDRIDGIVPRKTLLNKLKILIRNN